MRPFPGKKRASYEPPTAEIFTISARQNILIQMSIELEVEDFEEGEDL